MKVSCQACGAKYTIADDKVRGRKVKIRCKSCGTPMVVDGQSEAPPPDSGSADAAAGGGAAGAGGISWSVNLSDTDQRTMTTDEIVAGWKTGEVTNDAFVWKDGMGDWVPILECAELKPLLGGSAPATGAGAPTPFGPTVVTSSPTASTASARLAGGGRGAAVDLFDAAGSTGPEEDDVATSAPALPQAGSTAYDDGKMTGARNENSVLFSLDALKGGMSAEPKKSSAPARRPGAPVGGDPFAMSASETGGGNNALFSLNANQALLTAPAPPEPPPPRVSMSGAPGAPPMNKLVVYGGAGAGAVILLLLGLLLGRGTGSKEAAAPDASGKEQAAATTSAESDKKTEAKSDQAKPADTSTASASDTASAKEAASAAPTSTGATKVASTSPTTKSSTKEAKETKEKEKAEKAEKAKAEETMPSQGSAPFSVSAAQVALTQAASNAASCAKAAGPTGTGKVQVTFATSGRVTTATVMGPPFAGTPVGGCVAGVFRKARVPAYAGNPITVSKSFSIH